MQGTIINTIAVIAGSSVGLLIHSRLPKRFTSIAFHGIGLFTLFLGVKMALATNEILLMVISIVSGAIIGEWIGIDKGLEKFSLFLKNKIGSKNQKFSDGFITSFLLFCMGSMTILGAIEEGMGGEPNLLLAKSVMDGFSSIALAAAMGIGVMFSAIPLFIYQGGLTLFAELLGNYFSDAIITELTAVGGLLLIGLGINILEIKQLKIINMLPGLIIIVILTYFFAQ